MASLQGYSGVSTLHPDTGSDAVERSHAGSSSSASDTPPQQSPTSDENKPSSAASLPRLPEPVDPELQTVLDWIDLLPLWNVPDWITFPLAPEQFAQFQDLEQRGHFSGANFKYDYSEADKIIAFRMAGVGHEAIVSRLKARISQGLKDAATQDETPRSSREFALLPSCDIGSAKLWYESHKAEGMKVQRQPDAQFQAKPDLDPSLVIEVAWTRSTRKLKQLAYDYILGSRGKIRTVIGFDVSASAGKAATVSIWRAVCDDGNTIDITCVSTEVRSKSGFKNPNPRAGLYLTLEDFAYDRIPDEYPDLDSALIFIPADDLYAILEESEAVQEHWEARRDAGISLPTK